MYPQFRLIILVDVYRQTLAAAAAAMILYNNTAL
jgi:hypothetical protein